MEDLIEYGWSSNDIQNRLQRPESDSNGEQRSMIIEVPANLKGSEKTRCI